MIDRTLYFYDNMKHKNVKVLQVCYIQKVAGKRQKMKMIKDNVKFSLYNKKNIYILVSQCCVLA